MSRLKFVIKEPHVRVGKQSWILKDLNGNEIHAYSYFCKKTLDLSAAAHKRYAEAVAHFIDYLIAAQAFGVPASRDHVNEVLDAYPFVLASGSEIKLAEVRAGGNPDDQWLIPVLEMLEIKPLAANSFDNTLAPINKFLSFSERLAGDAFELASFYGLEHRNDPRVLFDALAGSVQISPREVRNMRQNSMLGTVIRFRQDGITRPRGLHRTPMVSDVDPTYKAFPFEQVLTLAAAATSYRDRAFWLLLAASGLRTSEAKALRWDHIVIATQEILVMDPRGLRVGRDIARQEVIRFKGRLNRHDHCRHS